MVPFTKVAAPRRHQSLHLIDFRLNELHRYYPFAGQAANRGIDSPSSAHVNISVHRDTPVSPGVSGSANRSLRLTIYYRSSWLADRREDTILEHGLVVDSGFIRESIGPERVPSSTRRAWQREQQHPSRLQRVPQ